MALNIDSCQISFLVKYRRTKMFLDNFIYC